MDGKRFDQITRGLAAGANRRGFLKGMLGTVAGLSGLRAVENAEAACRPGGYSCQRDSDCCSTKCGSSSSTGVNRVCCTALTQAQACGSRTCGTVSNGCGGTVVCGTNGGTCTGCKTCNASTGQCIDDNSKCSGAGPCQTNACSNGVCTKPAKPNNTPCNDGNSCTTNDTCQGGVCQAGPRVDCSAPDECHASSTCNPATGQCGSHSLLTGWCFIDGVCYQSGAQKEYEPCRVCAPATSTSAWSNAANGSSCEDGNACTTGDTCQDGACVYGTVKQCPNCQSCDTSTGNCALDRLLLGTPCDGGPCSSEAVCNVNGICQILTANPNGSSCGNDLVCCAGNCVSSGCCPGQTCDDGNECTGTGLCNENRVCIGNPHEDLTNCTGGKCCSGTCVAGAFCCNDDHCGDDTYCSAHICVAGCNSSGDCSDSHPICTGDANTPGVCVECLDNSQCGECGLCNETTNTCFNAPNGVADSCDGGICCDGFCFVGGECCFDCDCGQPGSCDPSDHSCYDGCKSDDDCTRVCINSVSTEAIETNHCNAGSGQCVECTDSSQCGSGEVCDLDTFTCNSTGCEPDCGANQTCNEGSCQCATGYVDCNDGSGALDCQQCCGIDASNCDGRPNSIGTLFDAGCVDCIGNSCVAANNNGKCESDKGDPNGWCYADGACQECLPNGLQNCEHSNQCCSNYCDIDSGTCISACLGNGNPCTLDADCCSGRCNNGICTAKGGIGNACNDNGDCDSGRCCDNLCTGLPANQGAVCNTGCDCLSGFCADGYCCDSACEGLCNACNSPNFEGVCRDLNAICPALDICHQGLCTDGSCSTPFDCRVGPDYCCPGCLSCGGDGNCTASISPCIADLCQDPGSAICNGDGSCSFTDLPAGAPGACGGGFVCDGDGSCVQCISNDNCVGACRMCSEASCINAPLGTDPKEECGAGEFCDGFGNCESA